MDINEHLAAAHGLRLNERVQMAAILLEELKALEGGKEVLMTVLETLESLEERLLEAEKILDGEGERVYAVVRMNHSPSSLQRATRWGSLSWPGIEAWMVEDKRRFAQNQMARIISRDCKAARLDLRRKWKKQIKYDCHTAEVKKMGFLGLGIINLFKKVLYSPEGDTLDVDDIYDEIRAEKRARYALYEALDDFVFSYLDYFTDIFEAETSFEKFKRLFR